MTFTLSRWVRLLPAAAAARAVRAAALAQAPAALRAHRLQSSSHYWNILRGIGVDWSMQMDWIKRQMPQREPSDEQTQQRIAQALRAIPAIMAEAQLSPQQSALVLAVSIGSMIAERFPEDHQLMMARLCAETTQKAMAANRREGLRPIPWQMPHAAMKATNCDNTVCIFPKAFRRRIPERSRSAVEA